MDLSWVDLAQPVVGGLAAVLGVHLTQDTLAALRRKGLCPDRWTWGRTSLRPRREEP
jgi:hypothetical protein